MLNFFTHEKYFFLYLFTLVFFFPLYSKALTKQENKVWISNFQPYKTETNPKLASQVESNLEKSLNGSGFTVEKARGNSLSERLQNAKKAGGGFLIEGYYKREKGNLYLYSQIYDVEKQKLIDAYNKAFDFPELENIQLDQKEIAVSDEAVIREFVEKVTARIKSNPRKLERRENINEYVEASPISKDMNIEVPKEDIEQATKAVFQILEEDNSISIVSKRVGQVESAEKTSAIVTVLSRRKIQDSGARNLADLLKQVAGVEVFYDQFGFYKVAFRGVRSKSGVLLLVDGHRINNFYDGSTFLDIRADAIEKIEIIRGPGSSVHGTNAFVGVVNVVTRSSFSDTKKGYVASRFGSYNTLEPSVFYGTKLGESWKFSGYASQFETKGQKIHIENDVTCTPAAWSSLACNRTIIPLPLNKSITTNDRKKQTNGFLNVEHNNNFFTKLKVIQEKRGPHVGEIAQVTPESEIGFNLVLGSLGFQKIDLTEKISLSIKLYGDMYRRKDDIEVERKDNLSHLGVSSRQRTSYIYETQGVESILQWNLHPKFLLLLGAQYERLIVRNFSIEKNYIRSETSPLMPFIIMTT